MSKLYCCYSINLRNYLLKNNVKYEVCGLNPNNSQMFWVYVKDEKLNNLLTEWSNLKH